MAREEKKKKFGLLNPDGASTGLLDKVRATIVKARYVDGADAPRSKDFKDPVVLLAVTYELEDGSAHDDYLIAANKKTQKGDALWEVSDDGLTLVPQQSEEQTLWKGSEAIQYMEHLAKAGVPKTMMSDDADCIEGITAFFERVDLVGRQPNEKGRMPQILAAKEGSAELPGKAKGAAKSTARGASSAKAAAKDEPEGDAEEKAVEYILDALKAADNGKMTLKELGDAVFTAATQDKLAKALKNEISEIVDSADKVDALGQKNGWTVNERRGTIALD